MVRIVLAVNSILSAEGMRRLLVDGGHDVVAVAHDVDAMTKLAERELPDVVVVGGRLPPTRTDEHIRAAMQLRDELPHVGVLLLGRKVELELAGEMLARRADRMGYLLKDRIESVEQFLDAVAAVARGASVFDPMLVSQLLTHRKGDDGLGRLTPREREVLGLMAQGLTNAAIAKRLAVSSRAVEKHVASTFDKLALPASDDDHRRVLAVLRYLSR